MRFPTWHKHETNMKVIVMLNDKTAQHESNQEYNVLNSLTFFHSLNGIHTGHR